jgi:hypothetical protein
MRHRLFAVVLVCSVAPGLAWAQGPTDATQPKPAQAQTPQNAPDQTQDTGATGQKPQPTPVAPTLKASVTLLNALANNETAAVVAPPGPLQRGLTLQVNGPLKNVAARLTVTDVESTSAPGDVVSTTLSDGTNKAASSTPLAVALNQGSLVPITLTGGPLRPSSTYKGWLVIAAGTDQHRWEITITSGGLGTLVADPIGPIQFVTSPFKKWVGEFSFTLRDKSGLGPYHGVRVYADPFTPPSTRDVKSNVTLDNFAFDPSGDANFVEQPAFKTDRSTATLTKQLNVKARIRALAPGEYTGGVRFTAANAAEDAADAKLPLTLRIRHHWFFPVLWIVLGSAVGWYSAKYVVAARKARELARKVRELRARADFLARRDAPRRGWSFASESTSYALAKVRVLLSQLTQRASAIAMMVDESEITEQQRDAEARMARLEMLREKRLRVEPEADGRPGAQLALRRLLQRALNLLAQPTFSEPQQAEFTTLLQTADGWLAGDTRRDQYRLALLRRRQSQEIPDAAMIGGLPAADVKAELERLLNACPNDVAITGAKDVPALQVLDRQLATLALVWRERDYPWAADLAQQSAPGADVDQLFELVDRKFWEHLQSIKDQLTIVRDTTSMAKVETLDVVELFLEPGDGELKSRILFHPLRVVWTITPPDGNVRTGETDGMTLVQYFATEGKVLVSAVLRWRKEEIPIPGERELTVVAGREYGRDKLVLSGGALEGSVLLLAILFAVVTAMSTQYDSTFGSFDQYLALFVWAAGAGSGGNLFKQLGADNVVGGATDVTLPART